LLVRDYGLWGFAVFAVPNVIGAAAMGWVMRSAEQSQHFTAEHSFACGLFSLVTICFHGFFLGWIGTKLLGRPDLVAVAFAVLTIAMFLLMRAADGLERWLGVATALVSWVLFMFVLRYRLNLGIVLPDSRPAAVGDIAALAGVCLLGFALCPYLDRTFHFARQHLDSRGARKAVVVGFGVVFFSMILFTLIYVDLILATRLNQAVALLLLTHIVVQSSFTVAAHGAVVLNASRGVLMFAMGAGCFAIGCVADYLVYGQMRGGELGYRLFMSIYGLLAPAYVWVVATRGRPTQASLLIYTLSVLAAAPFFWLAFIENMMPWAAVGVALVVLARLGVLKRWDAGSA
jgi:hypothetical protein